MTRATIPLGRKKRTIKQILEKRPPKVIYHYTSQDGLFGIVESKSIWASHIQYLNDYRELSYTIDRVVYELNELKNRKSSPFKIELLSQMISDIERSREVNVFVCSFSQEPNLLSQWRGYCLPNPGYAIGLKTKTLISLAKKQNSFLAPCEYDESTQVHIILEIINDTLALLDQPKLQGVKTTEESIQNIKALSWKFIEKIVTFASIFKHSSFSEEKEWRLISKPMSMHKNSKIGYHGKNSMIIPHYIFDLTSPNGNIELGEVVIGPTPNRILAMKSVGEFLASKTDDWGLSYSDIPYRYW